MRLNEDFRPWSDATWVRLLEHILEIRQKRGVPSRGTTLQDFAKEINMLPTKTKRSTLGVVAAGTAKLAVGSAKFALKPAELAARQLGGEKSSRTSREEKEHEEVLSSRGEVMGTVVRDDDETLKQVVMHFYKRANFMQVRHLPRSPAFHDLFSPSLTCSHLLSPSLTFSHLLSPSLTFSRLPT